MIGSATSRASWMVHFWLVAAGVVLWAAPEAPAQRTRRDSNVPTKTSPRFLAAFCEVVAVPSRSTVRIYSKEAPLAFGAVVFADGWILTKASELKEPITCELHDGHEFRARIVGVSEPYDLAMLKIDAKGLKPVEWRDSKYDAAGSWVATPGKNPEPVAVGVLSVGARNITGKELTRRSTSVGFLGIIIARTPVKDGVKIAEIILDGAAAEAGFEEDDIIVAVGKDRITDPDALFKALQKTKPGMKVTVRVKRGSEEVELHPTLGSQRPDRADIQNRLGSKLSDRRTGFPVVLQHDTVLRPVDCGGPLVDLDGKVIGINIARAGRTETLAIPAEVVKPLLNDLKSGKLARPK
ncbi:MAG TPA: trypsin-like peptidase domain-containing protein [Gemmataceae bacterium]|nr:trypsin-like peptidase domain-containing protein [Gemmataceae bacterium]